MADLTEYAGFPLDFDPETLEIAAGDGLIFRRGTRRAQDMQDVLMAPGEVAPEETVYMMDMLEGAPRQVQAMLDRYDLIYSTVLIPPRQIGNEYAKTAGHYHPPIPGTTLGYPEVYTQLYGRMLLVLQRRSGLNPEEIMDYVVVEMVPGFVITIPPNYAHCLVNHTGEPALMAGLYGRSFKPDYVLTRARHGLAYYVVCGAGGRPAAVPNPHYPTRPEVTWLRSLDGTHFAPDFPGRPVWSSFVANPEAFAFLTAAEPARRRFPNWT